MTNARSPLNALKKQADEIAAKLKAMERGDGVSNDVTGKLAAARAKDAIEFAVVMDDKILRIKMPWAAIRDMSEAGISAYILKHMRGQRDSVH